ncbi:zinc finger protein 37-like [Aricia agestis]|uniref:zinc finger protein 37-like n=1 Tax=Aricia agestis TaxID=91739 RepID=UPI001C20A6E6|nr:zinc finger protein 37-like [Aricia agestis]
MLQNNGPFGPNEVSVNPQANMTIMSGQNMSVENNLNNLSKISQPLPHPTNAFHLPDYVNYGLNMNSTISPFHNFNQVSYQQNLMSQNALQDSWQQNPLPMTLNTQNDISAHGYYDKKLQSQSDVSNSYSRNMLNIPQVYSKQYKHFGMESYQHYNHAINGFNQYFDHNLDLRLKQQKQPQTRQYSDVQLEVQKLQKPAESLQQIDLRTNVQKNCEKLSKTHESRNFDTTQPFNHGNLDLNCKQYTNSIISEKSDNFTENCHYNKVSNTLPEEKISYTDQNLDLSTKYQKPEHNSVEGAEKLPMDQARRRNLANTVKMIEDILNQTTIARQKEIEVQQTKAIACSTDKEEITLRKDHDKIDDNSRLSDKSYDDSNSKIEQIFRSDDDVSNISTCESIVSQKKDVENMEIHKNQPLIVKQELPMESDSSEGSDDEMKDKDVVVKIEIDPDLDIQYLYPFLRDSSGVKKDSTENFKVHETEQSINIAKEAIKNGNFSNLEYFECPYCNLCFNHPKRFLVHVKWHSFGLTNEKREEMQKAKEMRKQLQREARVLERIKKDEVTEAESTEGKNYNCKDCDKVFCKKSSLRNHQQRYHPNKNRECKICGKVLVGWNALRDHHLTHAGESGYQCPECPKRFKYSHSLAKHRDTHLEKTHACPRCPKMFGSAALLNVHSKTHDRMLRGATFRCTYCGKGFFESYHLQAHERTHRNERPFVCEICKTSFGTNSGLKRHLKVSHSTSKPFECTICHRSFISEAIRDRHEMRNHGNPEDFKFLCKQCPCRYLKQKDLRKHVYKVHPKGKRKKKSQSESE